jgi:hypothetical protein
MGNCSLRKCRKHDELYNTFADAGDIPVDRISLSHESAA